MSHNNLNIFILLLRKGRVGGGGREGRVYHLILYQIGYNNVFPHCVLDELRYMVIKRSYDDN